jgi:chromosome partitioning protein
MLSGTRFSSPRKIVVLNAKGGSGKTTLATNIAAWCAERRRHRADGLRPAGLLDALAGQSPREPAADLRHRRLSPQSADDPQLAAADPTGHAVPRRRHLGWRPAAADHRVHARRTRHHHPGRATDIDIHAAAGFISDLLLVAKEDRRKVACRSGRQPGPTGHRRAGRLLRFLDTLAIPCLTVLRDSQVYAHAAQLGLGLHEFKPHQVSRDLEQWEPLLRWIEQRCAQPVAHAPLSPGEHPSAAPSARRIEAADAF